MLLSGFCNYGDCLRKITITLFVGLGSYNYPFLELFRFVSPNNVVYLALPPTLVILSMSSTGHFVAMRLKWEYNNSRTIGINIYWLTSSARSATLEDTSWAWLHLASWNLSDSQFSSESKTEPKFSRHRTKLGGGDTAQKKCIPGGGDTAHVFWKGCQ